MSDPPRDLASALALRLEGIRLRIEETGGELDRLEVRALLEGEGSARSAAEAVLVEQLAALPSGPQVPVEGLGELVLRLLRLGTNRGAVAEQAARRVASAQAPDGGFGPPAAEPEALRLRRSAHLTGWLASGPFGRPSVLRRASSFLLRAWSPARLAGTSVRDLAAWAHFFSHPADEEAVEQADAAVAWCGRELERSFRGGRIDPAGAARVLAVCDAVALPGGAVRAGDLLRMLAGTAPSPGGVAEALDEAWAIARLAELLHLPIRRAGAG